MGKKKDKLDLIIQSVCNEFGLRKSDLVSRSQTAELTHARGILALIVRESSDVTLTETARRLDRDRSGLSGAAKRMSRRVTADDSLAEVFNRIRKTIESNTIGADRSSGSLKDLMLRHNDVPFPEASGIIRSIINAMSKETYTDLPPYILPDFIKIDDESGFCVIIPENLTLKTLDDPITASYIAPEIHNGDESTPSGMVWSLAVLLFELLTGRNPFHSGENGIISDIRIFKPELPESMTLLFYRALESDPDLRIQNPEVFRRELSEVQIEIEKSSPVPGIRGDETPGHADTLTDFSHGPTEARSDRQLWQDHNFVGRFRELNELKNLLDDPGCRLISIVGPGGIGKSRLAYELSRHLTLKYDEGIYFIPLNPIHSPAFIPLAIGHILGIAFGGTQEPLNQLISYFQTKKILLVLDDFDRLLDGADQLSRLVRETKGVDILVTSRGRLNLREERVYQLGGLEVPDGNEGKLPIDFSSVRLFRDNAERLRMGYEFSDQDSVVVAQICRLLEGLPLAIELASGWIRVLTCEEILKEIQKGIDVLKTSEWDRAERHQSMRATFDRSWAMLDEQEKRIVSRLSVFRAGFNRDAASSIAGASIPILRSLVDKSLVQMDIFGRYRIHELLRQYAEEKLSEDADQNLISKQAHARFYGSFLVKQDDVLRSEQMTIAHEEIEQERGNIDAGFEWSIRNDDIESITAYFKPLSTYFQSKSQFMDGEQLFSEALHTLEERFSGHESENTRSIGLLVARLKVRLALQKGRLGKYDSSEMLAKESLLIFEAANEEADIDSCISILANIARKQGRYKEALDIWKGVLARVEGSKSIREARVKKSMATVLSWLGDEEQARGYYESACSISRNNDDPITLAQALNGLGDIAIHQDRGEEAREFYEKALTISRELGHEGLLHVTIDRLAGCAVFMGEYRKARRLYEEVLDLYRNTGSKSNTARGLYTLGNCLNFLNEYTLAQKYLEESVDLYRSIGEIPGEAFSLTALGLAYRNLDQQKTAEKHYERALSLFEGISNAEGIITALTLLAACQIDIGKRSAARSNFRRAIMIYRKYSYKTRLFEMLLDIAHFFEKEKLLRDALIIRLFVSSRTHVELRHNDTGEEQIDRLSISLEVLESIQREISGYQTSDILDFVLQRL